MKKTLMILGISFGVSALAWARGEQGENTEKSVTIEFIQWWEPELPSGALRGIMDDFEIANPGIKVKLISGPYSSTRDQIVAGAATGTLSDVVGLDGAWVNDLASQNAITPLDEFMTDGDFDSDEIAAIIKVDNKSYMFPVASFVYPVFINLDMMKSAGLQNPPNTRTEFMDAAQKMTDANANQYGWVLPLSLQTPNGIQNEVMSWVWASGKSMMKNGMPDLTNEDVISALEFVRDMYQKGLVSPGSFAKQEQDKVEEFVSGRIGMMVSSLAHINMIRERNPNLNFTISDFPVIDGYNGPKGLPYAAWGIGISQSSKHKKEAWKLVAYLMSTEVNSKLVSIANAFPGNVKAQPDFVKSDKLFAKTFKIFQTGYLANEFVGLPVAEELMRILDIEVQKILEGKQTVIQATENAQQKWKAKF